MQDLENILAKFTKIVSNDFCENVAWKTGFVKRSTSQLKGHEFAQAIMIPNAAPDINWYKVWFLK